MTVNSVSTRTINLGKNPKFVCSEDCIENQIIVKVHEP